MSIKHQKTLDDISFDDMPFSWWLISSWLHSCRAQEGATSEGSHPGAELHPEQHGGAGSVFFSPKGEPGLSQGIGGSTPNPSPAASPQPGPAPINTGCNWAKGHCPVLSLGNKAERQEQSAQGDMAEPNAQFKLSGSFYFGLRATVWRGWKGRLISSLSSGRGAALCPLLSHTSRQSTIWSFWLFSPSLLGTLCWAEPSMQPIPVAGSSSNKRVRVRGFYFNSSNSAFQEPPKHRAAVSEREQELNIW